MPVRVPQRRRGLLVTGSLVTGGVLLAAGLAGAAGLHGGHSAPALPGLGLGAALLFGLASSAHCAGMCGPLVGLYAGQLDAERRALVRRQHLLFNLGRTLAYANLGVLFGGVGLLLGIRPWTAGTVGVAAGLLVMALGARHLGRGGGIAAWLDRALAGPSGALGSVWRGHAALARSPGVALLGALHGFLPCPLLYVMFTSAVALGDPLAGGALLLAFGLGTVPALWGVGALARRLRPAWRPPWAVVFGWTVTAWGLVLFARGLLSLGLF